MIFPFGFLAGFLRNNLSFFRAEYSVYIFQKPNLPFSLLEIEKNFFGSIQLSYIDGFDLIDPISSQQLSTEALCSTQGHYVCRSLSNLIASLSLLFCLGSLLLHLFLLFVIPRISSLYHLDSQTLYFLEVKLTSTLQ